jgi:50S ribosomal subunit-associated GTPase HflX
VLDASDPLIAERYKAVRLILEEMELATIPECVVLNKIDKVSPDQLLPLVETYNALTTSAAKGEGIRNLFLEAQKMVHELTPAVDDQAAAMTDQEEELDW